MDIWDWEKYITEIEPEIRKNIQTLQSEIDAERRENGGVVSVYSSSIFRFIKKENNIFFVEPKAETEEQSYDILTGVHHAFRGEKDCVILTYKLIVGKEPPVLRYGVLTNNIDLDMNAAVNITSVETDETPVDSWDIYYYLKDVLNPKGEFRMYEWRYVNHLSFYAIRPFWANIINEAEMNNTN